MISQLVMRGPDPWCILPNFCIYNLITIYLFSTLHEQAASFEEISAEASFEEISAENDFDNFSHLQCVNRYDCFLGEQGNISDGFQEKDTWAHFQQIQQYIISVAISHTSSQPSVGS